VHIDLLPTFVELTASKVPTGIQKRDGRSLLPVLENPKADCKDRYLFIHKGRWEKGADPDKSKYSSCTVRNARFRLVNNTELYDIQNDPGEKRNVIDKHSDVVKAMRAAYDQWWKEMRPLMVNEDVPYAKQQPYTVLYERQLKAGGIPTVPRTTIPP